MEQFDYSQELKTKLVSQVHLIGSKDLNAFSTSLKTQEEITIDHESKDPKEPQMTIFEEYKSPGDEGKHFKAYQK